MAKSVFVAYALALATATHWPDLSVSDVGFELNDKLVHFGAFACWTVLLGVSGWAKATEPAKLAVFCLLIASSYAVVDELTQGLAIFHRQVDAFDLLANLLGTLSGSVALVILGRHRV